MTERLYYLDSYLHRFEAKLISASSQSQRIEVILDRTAFYPTSGGQPHDLGYLQGVPVLAVYENDLNQIVHCLESPIGGSQIQGEIDWSRRFDHMQQHSGQHVLSQAFLQTAGFNTVGFHLGEDYATIDLNGMEVSSQQLKQAEDLANTIVYENRPVRIRAVSSLGAPALGLRKETEREGPLRIVEVEGFDVSACGGTHVSRTGEIAGIFIRKTERVNRQTRVEFVCGYRSLQSYRVALECLVAAARKFSVGFSEVPLRVDKLIEENQQWRKILQEKNRALARLEARELYEKAPELKVCRIVKRLTENEELDFLKLLAQALTIQGPCIVLLGNRQAQAQLVFAATEALDVDLRPIMKECCLLLEGRGGGSRTLVQGGGRNIEQLQAALDLAEARLRSGN
jgi:alanyl-tRNA synthetase